MELSLQSVHPDIFDRVALYLPLSSRLQLAATCRSMKSKVVFKDGRSQLENLPASVLHKTMLCMSSHADRLRLGAASWTLRKWTIQNGMLTLHCDRIHLHEDYFMFLDEYEEDIGVLPFRDGDLPIRATTWDFSMRTDFSRAHIDQSIRCLSAFRPPLRPDHITLFEPFTLDGQSDDPTAVRRLVEYLGGTSRPLDTLSCRTGRNETLLLESDFLHRVQARYTEFCVGDIGPDGLDLAVEDSVQEDAQPWRYPCVGIILRKCEHSTSSAPMVFNSLLRFIRAHFSPSLSARFKYEIRFKHCGDMGSAAIRTLADECGVQLETCSNDDIERLRFTTSSDPTRRIVSTQRSGFPAHRIFVGADQEPEWWLRV